MSPLARRLGIEFPLLQAGMGGVAGPALAAAVADAGAAGTVALYRSPPAAVAALVAHTRALTARPFGVNLIPELMPAQALMQQVESVLDTADRSVFFTCFGLPGAVVAQRVRRAGHALLVMVGTLRELRHAQALGVDGAVLQGTEAGGHLLGTHRLCTLLQHARAAGIGIPLVAAGGIGHGGDLRRLRARFGIDAVLCGTLFAATRESLAHDRYKQRLVTGRARDTVVATCFDGGWPGRRHRVLRNALTAAGAAGAAPQPRHFIATTQVDGRRHPIPRYAAAVPTGHTEGHIDEMAMYGGLSVDAVHDVPPAAARVQRFIEEYEHADV